MKSGKENKDSQMSDAREDAVLAKLLATPPDHKTKPKPDASPKKRGRPPKATPKSE
jgi:hypothetical protein